ncbi:hypothetical protein REPUB_Repub02eG0287800 [Reevesia pubescens]
MPLTRYQIRNVYSLGDPELYRAADKDDPEALLEGVAMSGLVGVLRQLGDLAEFAVEIFHDLHEEVMTTAARGHGLMVRVQQLEAEFPSIEKAFLSQTDHSLFFTNTGVDWHPNLRTEHNLITRGDLPRCVLDSYEECRGPPRLFLLDKFDVAGAGACLKRYTDPSFFRAESAFPGIARVEGQREKKARKLKKKGSRWRNGQTPEFAPTSHAKLHQLLLEERIENAYNGPARLVKLKRRQLNESPLDSKSGKSYMEKFLKTPSPEHKAVYETSGIPPPLRLTLDNSSELGLEILEISTVSPVKNSSQGKETSSSSPTAQEVVLKTSMEELNGEVIDREIVKVPESTVSFTEGIPPPLHKVTIEKEITVDGEGRKECSIDGERSDDMISEVDNYMDALATMESEMDTDNEYRPKNDIGFVNIGKYQTISDANEEKLEVQAHSSDSQSVGISSVSDDGNSSLKKGRSSFSYSDTVDNLAEDAPSDVEVVDKVFPSNKNCVADIVDEPSIQPLACSEMQCSSSDKVSSPKDTSFGEHMLPDLGEASYSSCLEDLNSTHILLDQTSSMAVSLLEPQCDEVPSDGIKTNSDLSDSYGGKHLAESSEVIFADTSEKQEVNLISLSAENHPVDESGSGDTNVSSDDLPHLSNILQLASETRSGNHHLDVIKTDFAGDSCAENSVNQMMGSPNSVISSTEEQLPCSTLAEVERSSGNILSPEGLDVMKSANLASEVNDATLEAILNSECTTSMVGTSQTCGFNEQQFSGILCADPQLEADPTEVGASYSEQKQNVDELFDAAEGEETREITCSVNAVEGDAIPCDLPSDCADNVDLKDHVDLDDLATENVHAESIAVSTAACGSADFDDDVDDTTFQSSNFICSPSGNLMNLEDSLSGDGDLLQEGLESSELISEGCLIELETREETNQVEGVPADIDSTSCKSVSYNNSNLEGDIHYSSLAEPTKNSLNVVDSTTAPASSEFSDQESESKYLSHLMESRADLVSSPAHNLSEEETSLEQLSDFHTNQHDVRSLHIVEDSSNSLNLLSNEIQSLDDIDEEKCLQTSFEHSKEGFRSSLEFSEQSGGQDKQESHASNPIHPGFGLLPEATKVSMEEMPPLPPLPPMQWRIGRVQHVSPASQRELAEHGPESFPMIPQYGIDERGQFGLSALEQGIEQPGNPFSPLVDGEERSGRVSDQLAADSMQPSPFSMHLATMGSNANSQYNGICLDKTRSNPFLTLPTISNESLDHGSIAIEGDRVEFSYSLPVSSHEETTLPPNQFVMDTGLEGGAFQHPKQNSEGEHGNPPDISVPPPAKREEQIPTKVTEDLPTKVEEQFPTMVEEHPQHGLAASEGETAQTSNVIVQHGLVAPEGETALMSNTPLRHDLSTSDREVAWPSNMLALLPVVEEGNSNGNPTVKLPRPRNPLIDAVAAHDKSKVFMALHFNIFRSALSSCEVTV